MFLKNLVGVPGGQDPAVACSQDVPSTYFVGSWGSERRESVGGHGHGAPLWPPGGACLSEKGDPHKGFLMELRNSNAQ